MMAGTHNPDDLVFLLSRGMDGDLSPEEQRRLGDALAQSGSLRSEASKLQAVDRLIKRWGQEPVEVDWEHHAALTSAHVESADDKRLGKVDELLRQWRHRTAGIEAIDVTTGVLAKIRSERGRATSYRLVLQFGVPLAAAAAIALALTVATWFTPARDPIYQVAIGPASRSTTVAERGDGSRIVVSFAQSVEATLTREMPPAIGIATIGVEPLGSAGEESSPL